MPLYDDTPYPVDMARTLANQLRETGKYASVYTRPARRDNGISMARVYVVLKDSTPQTSAPVNLWMYETKILRIKDPYGNLYWVSKRDYDNPAKTMIPICNGKGLRRTYTKAGHDGNNMILRANIVQVLREREIIFPKDVKPVTIPAGDQHEKD